MHTNIPRTSSRVALLFGIALAIVFAAHSMGSLGGLRAQSGTTSIDDSTQTGSTVGQSMPEGASAPLSENQTPEEQTAASSAGDDTLQETESYDSAAQSSAVMQEQSQDLEEHSAETSSLALSEDTPSAERSSTAHTEGTNDASHLDSANGSSADNDDAAAVHETSSAPSLNMDARMELPSVHLQHDAPGASHTPTLIIGKSDALRNANTVVENMHVTLTASGTELPVELSIGEQETEFVVAVETPSIFRPGTYELIVRWQPARSIARMMETLFQTSGEDASVMLLQENIALGTAMSDLPSLVERTQLDDGFAVTRTATARTRAGATETMTIVVQPRAGLIGTVSEQVPPGCIVTDVAPPAQRTDENERGTTLVWERSFVAETPVTFRYTFIAPPQSPRLALFGPLRVRGEWTDDAVLYDAPITQSSAQSTESEHRHDAETSSGSMASASLTTATMSGSDISPAVATATETAVSSASTADVENASAAASSSVPSTLQEDETVDDAAETGSSATLSWFRRLALLAQLSLLQGERMSFEEPLRWPMLVERAEEAADSRLAGELLLDPLHGGVFDAHTPPSFTLSEDFAAAALESALDNNGHIREETAIAAVLRSITDEASIADAIVAQVLHDERESVADALSNDTETIALLVEDNTSRSAKREAKVQAESALEESEARAAAASAITHNADIRNALSAIITPELETSILEEAMKDHRGESAHDAQEVVRLSAGESAAETIASAIVADIQEKEDTRKNIAEAMKVAVQEQRDAAADTPVFTVTVRGKNGEVFTPRFHFVPGSVVLVLEPERAFTPGLYTAEVTLYNPLTGETSSQTAEFAWGVLAMNPQQDRYNPGDIVRLAIGVLDDAGNIVCNAKLTLEVHRNNETEDSDATEETEEPVASLTTENESIASSDTCGIKEAGLIEPDYTASFTAVEAGIYELTLTATTENGTRSITSYLEVADPPFLIRRIGATRLWPLAPSPMHITVTFFAPVTGTITETLPPGFSVSDIRPPATVHTGENGEKLLQWKGEWNEGEQATFRYLYDAPDISPQFYLLGPLKISSVLPFLHSQ